MNNKKTIMTVSALFILIFHLWINITKSINELYIRQLLVVGVDMFFFLSCYSIGKREIKYKEFIKNRILDIYIKFIILSVIYYLYKGFDLLEFIKTILGINLFIKGGGSFLWFIPGIMIVYLLLPLYKKIDNKIYVPIITIFIYLLVCILISYNTYYDEIFILFNRIPIMLIAYYMGKYNVINYLDDKKYWLITILLLTIGFAISYISIVNRIKLEWFYDIYYLIYIPFVLGLIMLLDKIKDNKLTNLLGSITLELYGLQMIFGYKIVNMIYLHFNNALLTNVLVIIVMVILSIILKYIFDIKKMIIK